MEFSLLGIDLWVFVTIIAAVTQTFRNAAQKRMKPLLGNIGASYIRFCYAMPFAWAGVIGYYYFGGTALPVPAPGFWLWISAASLMQAAFTVLLITLFSHRSFAAGTAFSKTEVLQTALFEALFLGVVVTAITGFSIAIGTVAVVILSLARAEFNQKSIIKALLSLQTLMGLMSGACLGLSNVLFKGAIQRLEGSDVLLAAFYSGATAATLQAIVMGALMAVFIRHQWLACIIYWRQSLAAGFFGAVATTAWFTAFALYSVSAVRAVGQIELLITLSISIFYFREKINALEGIAIAMLLFSIVSIVSIS